jgi:hypothetical protein
MARNATKLYISVKLIMGKLAQQTTSVFLTLALRFFKSQRQKLRWLDSSALTHRWLMWALLKNAATPLNVIQAVATSVFAKPHADLDPSAQLRWVVGLLINPHYRMKLSVPMATPSLKSIQTLQLPRLPSASQAFLRTTVLAYLRLTHRSTHSVHRAFTPLATVWSMFVQTSPIQISHSHGPSQSW